MNMAIPYFYFSNLPFHNNLRNYKINIFCKCIFLHISKLYLLFSYLVVSDEEGNGNPLQYSCLENPMDGGAW